MTTQESSDDIDSAEAAQGWPELDKLVSDVKTKRVEELARQEEQRGRAQKAAQDAERAWAAIAARACLEDLAARVQDLGVVARPVETLPNSNSAALELTRLPKGEAATIRIDTTPSRSGPPRTTVQVQRGNQQLPAVIISSNTNGELRKSLVDIAQKLLA
jgi:hypothetical protein